MSKTEIHLYDAELLGGNIGTYVRDQHDRQIGHWPMGLIEAAERVLEDYPCDFVVLHPLPPEPEKDEI